MTLRPTSMSCGLMTDPGDEGVLLDGAADLDADSGRGVDKAARQVGSRSADRFAVCEAPEANRIADELEHPDPTDVGDRGQRYVERHVRDGIAHRSRTRGGADHRRRRSDLADLRHRRQERLHAIGAETSGNPTTRISKPPTKTPPSKMPPGSITGGSIGGGAGSTTRSCVPIARSE